MTKALYRYAEAGFQVIISTAISNIATTVASAEQVQFIVDLCKLHMPTDSGGAGYGNIEQTSDRYDAYVKAIRNLIDTNAEALAQRSGNTTVGDVILYAKTLGLVDDVRGVGINRTCTGINVLQHEQDYFVPDVTEQFMAPAR